MSRSLFVLVACVAVGVGLAIAHSMAGGQTIDSKANHLILGGSSRGEGVSQDQMLPGPAGAPLVAPIGGRIQWEYHVAQVGGGDLGLEQLQQLGSQGWEMCGVRQRGQGMTFFYFKREKLAIAEAGMVAEPPASYQQAPTFQNSTSLPGASNATRAYQAAPTFAPAQSTAPVFKEGTQSVLKSSGVSEAK